MDCESPRRPKALLETVFPSLLRVAACVSPYVRDPPVVCDGGKPGTVRGNFAHGSLALSLSHLHPRDFFFFLNFVGDRVMKS